MPQAIDTVFEEAVEELSKALAHSDEPDAEWESLSHEEHCRYATEARIALMLAEEHPAIFAKVAPRGRSTKPCGCPGDQGCNHHEPWDVKMP